MNKAKARRFARACFLLALIHALMGSAQVSQSSSGSTAATRSSPGEAISGSDQTIAAAGDIVDCGNLSGSEATAKLLDNIPGTILAVGDLAYPDGSTANFRCYDKTWGRHKARTRPAPGNHEYHTPGAAGYFQYFGKAAGPAKRGYYSFDLGPWHIIALNSECAKIGGCNQGSPEEVWLQEDLRKNTSKCILAFWHTPLFSSGDEHGNDPKTKAFWLDLYAAGADVVLNGHDHDYERFAPQNPDGGADPERGIREFVVGTGGKSQRKFRDPSPTSEVRSNASFGVLEIDLHAQSYEWKFIPVAGGEFTDSGSGTCHLAHQREQTGN
jgi:hypothetical protein